MKLFNDYWVQKHLLERIKLRGWKKDTKALKDLSKKGKEILRTPAPLEHQYPCTVAGCGKKVQDIAALKQLLTEGPLI